MPERSGPEAKARGQTGPANSAQSGADGRLCLSDVTVGHEGDGIACQGEGAVGPQAVGQGPVEGGEAQAGAGQGTGPFPPQEKAHGAVA